MYDQRFLYLLIFCAVTPAAAQSAVFTFSGDDRKVTTSSPNNTIAPETVIETFALSGRFEAVDTNSDGIYELSEVLSIAANADYISDGLLYFAASVDISSLDYLQEFTYSGNGFLDRLSFQDSRVCDGASGPEREVWGSASYTGSSVSQGAFSVEQPNFDFEQNSSTCGVFDFVLLGEESFPVLVSAEIPLPASLPLFLTGIAGMGWLGSRRRR